ncbi:MAG: PA0069 family radical SAM protein [Phycisphaerae bacterium]
MRTICIMGLRRVDNPPNPFLTHERVWLEEPPVARPVVYEEEAKSIVSTNDSPDIPFRWSVNPYRGCQHACAYCYARPTHEYLDFGAGTDFETRIVAKINAPALLEKALRKRSWQNEEIVFSGVTDCYQPQEAVYRLTRQCLELCARYRNPVGIVTKSFLIVRDIDILQSLNTFGGIQVYVSIAFADEAVARAVDEGAPSVARRFEAVRRLREAGVPTSVMVAPVIPGLNDRDIPEILKRAAEAGAQGAGMTALRLPGNVQPIFLQRLRAKLPHHAARVEARIRDIRQGKMNQADFGKRMKGEGVYWDVIKRMFDVTAEKYGLRGLRNAGDAPISAPKPKRFETLPLFPQ